MQTINFWMSALDSLEVSMMLEFLHIQTYAKKLHMDTWFPIN